MKEIVQFSKVFYKYKNQDVLRGLSFLISENDVVALVGNNGCGKTTTLKLLCGLIFPKRGQVSVLGKVVVRDKVAYRNVMGIILDTPYYIEEFSPVEYLNFVCRFQNVHKDQIMDRIKDVSKLVGLQNDLNKPIKKLSSGNQMKVSLASALIHNPKILVLDEPFVNLDIKTTENIVAILKSLKERKTILITSHNLDLITNICDRFLIMDQGKIVFEINKCDYPSIETLKSAIKVQLSNTNKIENLSWLG